MKTKALQRFESRINAFNTDLELADFLIRSFLNQKNSEQSISESISKHPTQYPHINNRKNNTQSRKIIGQHLKRTIHVGYIKEIYEDFYEFLSTSLANASETGIDSKHFIGNAKIDVSAAEILNMTSIQEATRYISEKIFRTLENERNTQKLIKRIADRLGLNINLKLISDAMPYLDSRHIFVHRDGKPDDYYKKSYPNIPIKNKGIETNYQFVTDARSTVLALAENIDEEIIANKLCKKDHLHGPQKK
ncbi:hypothetical protein [Thalassospira alkalitolerans]|uniref:hypothetical protein n=1 Tax=Thalassospira alkalitolerans TaxID=1293890 RepID=UPI003AA8E5A8